ncbi:MAG: PAS domain S-box protein [Proteobacteria bacterium]|nr:PAS domain S-box protein [Pseudomonadota bacterium]
MENKTKSDKSLQAEEQKRVAAGFNLRKSAEEHLRKSKAKSEVFGDTQKLIHELQVHQVELEMQNEELRKAQQELQASRDNYFDFYNFSPVGYFAFDEKGLMLDLNLTSAALLGVEKQKLINRNFKLYISPDSRPVFNTFCKKVLEADTKHDCELKLDASARAVLMEGISVPDAEGHGKKIRAVMIDITERKEMEEKLRKGKEMLEKAMKDIFHVLMSTIEKRMSQAPKNRQGVVKLACAIAGEMGISAGRIEGIAMAGSILDLGYISVPVELLSKPLKLTGDESQLVQTHVQTGYEILEGIEFPWPLAEMVLQHHERIDGSGYPHGLKNDDIHLEAKILAVADTVEAICCDQTYRPGLGIEKALEEIEKNKGVLYDEKVVEACLKLFREKQFKFE